MTFSRFVGVFRGVLVGVQKQQAPPPPPQGHGAARAGRSAFNFSLPNLPLPYCDVLRRCVLSSAASYATPLGAMAIDQQVYGQLQATGEFDTMNLDVDEDEHSLELHTPYIMHAMAGQPFSLVPIMVGALSSEDEARYGRILGRYMDDPANLFVISSDFCHWGSRFSYTFYDPAQVRAPMTWMLNVAK